MLPYIAIILFSIADHFLTYWEIARGLAAEANPILQGIMTMPVGVSLVIRLAWILFLLLLFLFLLLLLWKLSKHKPVFAKRAVLFLAGVYGLVIAYHIFILTTAAPG